MRNPPSDSLVVSCMMAYPCLSPSARAKRMKKTAGVSGISRITSSGNSTFLLFIVSVIDISLTDGVVKWSKIDERASEGLQGRRNGRFGREVVREEHRQVDERLQ